MEELIVCVEEDLDDETADLVQPLQGIVQNLRALQSRVRAGDHQFANGEDLPFMALARSYRRVIPIYSSLNLLNQAHRLGVV